MSPGTKPSPEKVTLPGPNSGRLASPEAQMKRSFEKDNQELNWRTRMKRTGCNLLATVFLTLTAGAQSFEPEVLVSFNYTNGAFPYAGLELGSDGDFYGATSQGGAAPGPSGFGTGTVFKLTTNGTFTTLAEFDQFPTGYWPNGLTLGLDGNFYGTTAGGGANDLGAVFKVTSSGILTRLMSFNNVNGANPYARLLLAPDGNFYGTTYNGGASGYGTVFRVTTNGTLTTLASFNNVNGAHPWATPALGKDGNFYGTAYGGGGSGLGTVFRMTPGGALTRLVSFNSANGAN